MFWNDPEQLENNGLASYFLRFRDDMFFINFYFLKLSWTTMPQKKIEGEGVKTQELCAREKGETNALNRKNLSLIMTNF